MFLGRFLFPVPMHVPLPPPPGDLMDASKDISSDLKYPKSAVAYVIKKWKVSGDCRNVPRVGRPTKLGDRDRRVLTREIRKNRTQLMVLIREEFQQASGSVNLTCKGDFG
ncbi:protein-tyrosine sulfotransferase [Caerostris extrusa]|uniref:Protein-tyrosine sulfotransferase n=1 Tax=Caerostris extrusa TaxID=172846 RepID=A0AAV4NRW9_CAEEX|nr:protein-tyrosine sulfotransferase [Caerostris extrusa]